MNARYSLLSRSVTSISVSRPATAILPSEVQQFGGGRTAAAAVAAGVGLTTVVVVTCHIYDGLMMDGEQISVCVGGWRGWVQGGCFGGIGESIGRE